MKKKISAPVQDLGARAQELASRLSTNTITYSKKEYQEAARRAVERSKSESRSVV